MTARPDSLPRTARGTDGLRASSTYTAVGAKTAQRRPTVQYNNMFAAQWLARRVASTAKPRPLRARPMVLLRPAVVLQQCHKRGWLSTKAAGAVPYQLVVRMDIPADKDQLFNDVYNEHCENLRLVPGVLGIRRYKTGKSRRSVIGLQRRPEVIVRP
jgi:hypothetical protein